MAAHELGAGAAIFVSLAGVVAAVGVAVAVVAWRRGLLSVKEFAAAVGLTVAGAVLLTLLAPTAAPAPEPGPAPPPSAGLAQRADALLARAIAPNSPLACIDAAAGDQVEAACEAVLFGRPETIAAAVSYVTAKLALLSHSRAAGGTDDHALALLRQNLAADRYGIVAHVLAATAGCSLQRCDAFALVKDSSRIKTNLRDGTFERLVARHAAEWPAATDAGDKTSNAGGASPPGKPVSSRYDFPSAASIPPVSIMVPEQAPPATEPAAAAPATPAQPAPLPRASPTRTAPARDR